jgi:hypothetical protein
MEANYTLYVYVHIHKLFFADLSCLKLIICQLIGTYGFRETSFICWPVVFNNILNTWIYRSWERRRRH